MEPVTAVTQIVTVTPSNGSDLPGVLGRARVVDPVLGLELTSQLGVGPEAKPPIQGKRFGPKITDRRGERFHRLTIIDYAWDRPGRGWRCRCDCGKETLVKYALLTNGNTKSCGCLRADRNRERNARNTLPPGEASFRGLFAGYKRNASKRGLAFDLSESQFRGLTKQPCAYCGLPPTRQYLEGPNTNGAYTCNGVDRLVNDEGYTVENSLPCCVDCNWAKGSLPAERWLAMLNRIASHSAARARLKALRDPEIRREHRLAPTSQGSAA
jgi:hypothetical protein